ncbi:MAG: hypothetical protein SFV81_23585 [Pirellulaceae bacterium]|nr:hypothetical protein [Pirellulaceae bacterium]
MLHQEREQDKAANLRDIIERDDVEAMRRYVASLPPNKLDEPDESTGHSIVQRAADAGAAKIVAFLIDSGARGIVGLGTVNVKRHTKVIKLLLTS